MQEHNGKLDEAMEISGLHEITSTPTVKDAS